MIKVRIGARIEMRSPPHRCARCTSVAALPAGFFGNDPVSLVGLAQLVGIKPPRMQLVDAQYFTGKRVEAVNTFRQTLSDLSSGFLGAEPLVDDATAVPLRNAVAATFNTSTPSLVHERSFDFCTTLCTLYR